MNIHEFLNIPALMFPDQEILIDGGVRLTYGRLLERVNRLAGALRAAGAGPGEHVAVLDVNSHRYVEAYLATAALGGTFVPLNFRAKHDELQYLVEASRVTTLFLGQRYRDIAPRPGRDANGGLRRWVLLDGATDGAPAHCFAHEALIEAGEREFTAASVEDEDIAILMFTSGTTSKPKGVNLTHGDFTLYVTNGVEMADGSERGAMLMVMPLYHIAGATNVLTSLFGGRKLVLQAQFEPGHWLESVERERVTHSFLVPTMLKRVLDHPDFARRDLSSLQNLAYGGALMPVPVIRDAIARFPKTTGFVNAFGQTETTSTLTVLGPEDHRLSGTAQEIEIKTRRLASVGRPMPDVELRIAGDGGQALQAGQIGEIWVRTARLMRGYEGIGRPNLREGGWHATGDMGWLDEGGYLFIAGRKDDLIIRGGENISPAEIESVLHAHPAVDEAAVIGLPDLEWGQRVVAAVVLRPGMTATEEALREFVHQRLAGYKRPDRVLFLHDLPKTATGKVLKRELPQLFGAGTESRPH